ncbi:hypothetical protein ACFQY9_20440 [Microvirga aerilata]|uniref:hypothetical protein n=1 Tax=Microvirga aerilata TaxID=670292 RepID=UPI0036313EA8
MNRNGQPFAFDRDIEWEPAGEGVRRKVLTYNPEVMMVRVIFEAGAIGTLTRIHTSSAASSSRASSTSPLPDALSA